MAGLLLGQGPYGAQMSQGAIPAAAGVSPGAPTIAQKAFGVFSQQAGNCGPRTAGYGTVALGLAGAAILVYLWYSLPR